MDILLIDPISLLEMLLAGIAIAVTLQLLLSYCYTRLGQGVFLKEDRWTAAYFGLNGCSWIVAAAIATFFVLPLSGVLPGRRTFGTVSLILCAFLTLILLRNRMQRPQQQSVLVTLFFSMCIVMGSAAGAVARLKHP